MTCVDSNRYNENVPDSLTHSAQHTVHCVTLLLNLHGRLHGSLDPNVISLGLLYFGYRDNYCVRGGLELNSWDSHPHLTKRRRAYRNRNLLLVIPIRNHYIVSAALHNNAHTPRPRCSCKLLRTTSFTVPNRAQEKLS